MGNKELQRLWLDRIFDRDREEFASGDTLDVKTGLILVMLIFLAGQSAEFFKLPVTSSEKYLQYISVCSPILGGAFAILELWPRTFFSRARTGQV